jgi:hypothetical protein
MYISWLLEMREFCEKKAVEIFFGRVAYSPQLAARSPLPELGDAVRETGKDRRLDFAGPDPEGL